jgi:hypothetical protein
MSNIKNTPKWKQYEWLISKIFHDNFASIETTVLPNIKMNGKYTNNRQIDILVDNNGIKTIIECKYHTRPLDVKNIESFIGMFIELNVDNGIIISSSGFTKNAEKRIKQFDSKIKLEHLNWEKAYENSFEYQSYGRISDICEHCYENFISGTEVSGLLLWEAGYALEKNKIQFLFAFAKCLKCNEITIYCDSCGVNTLVGKDEYCCQEALFFYQFLEDNAMTGKK